MSLQLVVLAILAIGVVVATIGAVVRAGARGRLAAVAAVGFGVATAAGLAWAALREKEDAALALPVALAGVAVGVAALVGRSLVPGAARDDPQPPVPPRWVGAVLYVGALVACFLYFVVAACAKSMH